MNCRNFHLLVLTNVMRRSSSSFRSVIVKQVVPWLAKWIQNVSLQLALWIRHCVAQKWDSFCNPRPKIGQFGLITRVWVACGRHMKPWSEGATEDTLHMFWRVSEGCFAIITTKKKLIAIDGAWRKPVHLRGVCDCFWWGLGLRLRRTRMVTENMIAGVRNSFVSPGVH